MSMQMSEQLEPLLKIQEIDIRLTDFGSQESEWISSIGASEERLADIDEILEQLKTERTELQMDRDRLQLEIDEEQERVNNYEKRIRDISNTREYQALSREVSVSKKARSDAEDAALLILDKLETIEATIATTQEERDGIHTTLEEQRGTHSEVKSDVDTKSGPLRKERDSVAGQVDPKVLAQYNVIRRRHIIAIVTANNETCNGCNRKLPPQLYNQILRNVSLISCPSCKRILLPPPAPQDDSNTPVAPQEEAQPATTA